VITAKRSRAFSWWFSRVARGRIYSTFGRVWIEGIENLEAESGESLMVIANHVCWWDPLVAIWLTNLVAPSESYAMMNAMNLRRLPFFARVGAFGVDLSSENDKASALKYAVKLLKQQDKVLWIFPQGDERPSFQPLEFRSGSAEIARIAKVRTVPIAIDYVFGEREWPDLYISCGKAFEPGSARERSTKERKERHEQAVATQQKSIREKIAAPNAAHGFQLVHQREVSFFAKLGERWLSLMLR
jgi:1-acyl-sn-glycerol-3-phosphate acyltransferase